jgi:bacillithiol biosynthesis cysteine-adding enzyme BshC
MLFTKQTLPIKDTNLFSDLFTDYINHSEKVKPFFQSHIFQTDFESYLKNTSFENIDRTILVDALKDQSLLVRNTSELSLKNINELLKQTTYTVTTGHQLCLFTGPLYFIYKIASTINLATTLKSKFPDKNFVPVYWMASEDHDFEEINHVNVFNKKVIWNSSQAGSVGDFNTEALAEVITELKTILGESDNAKLLIALFETAYLKHTTLSDATRYLVNELFGEYGIVILDGNDKALKALFKEEFKADIFENKSVALVNQSITELSKHYSAQVNPRDINVFYKADGVRERIERIAPERYTVVNTDLSFSKAELEIMIDTTPEKLSPNVVLRPLYQQKILPNIAYIGGPGELAYWLEFKTLFESYKINFPILMPRNFAMIIDKGTKQKVQKFDLSIQDLFGEGEVLVKQFIKTQHEDVNLNVIKSQFETIYASLTDTVGSIDKSLIASTEAEKQKTLNGIHTIEQKINRAFKQKSETDVNQLWALKGKLFPNNIPQERYDNMSMYYAKYGRSFITEMIAELSYDLNSFEYIVFTEN